MGGSTFFITWNYIVSKQVAQKCKGIAAKHGGDFSFVTLADGSERSFFEFEDRGDRLNNELTKEVRASLLKEQLIDEDGALKRTID